MSTKSSSLLPQCPCLCLPLPELSYHPIPTTTDTDQMYFLSQRHLSERCLVPTSFPDKMWVDWSHSKARRVLPWHTANQDWVP